jgi:hypothetical protein
MKKEKKDTLSTFILGMLFLWLGFKNALSGFWLLVAILGGIFIFNGVVKLTKLTKR